ncbi:hypothetical protein K7A35_01850 [Escherichia marmotae]|uniref:hypothetical protein n=1 Tax=Escherichia marmotae TaxID=1499973 RepID=UPI001C9AE3E2|nr:hypothetical protein [Escherichia marmotae]MBY7470169.1 hypothetical protein [Escherichia marmotae]
MNLWRAKTNEDNKHTTYPFKRKSKRFSEGGIIIRAHPELSHVKAPATPAGVFICAAGTTPPMNQQLGPMAKVR